MGPQQMKHCEIARVKNIDGSPRAGNQKSEGANEKDVENPFDGIAQRCLDVTPIHVDEWLVQELEKHGLERTHQRARKRKELSRRNLKKKSKRKNHGSMPQEPNSSVNKRDERHKPFLPVNKLQPYETPYGYNHIAYEYDDGLEAERRLICELNKNPFYVERCASSIKPYYEKSFDRVQRPLDPHIPLINDDKCEHKTSFLPNKESQRKEEENRTLNLSNLKLAGVKRILIKKHKEAIQTSKNQSYTLFNSFNNLGTRSCADTKVQQISLDKRNVPKPRVPHLDKLLYTIMCSVMKLRKPNSYYGLNEIISSCTKLWTPSDHTSKPLSRLNYIPVEQAQEMCSQKKNFQIITPTSRRVSTISNKGTTEKLSENKSTNVGRTSSQKTSQTKQIPSKQSTTYFSKEIERLVPELIDIVKESIPLNDKYRNKFVSLLEEQKDITKTVIRNTKFPSSKQIIQSVALYQLSDQTESTDISRKNLEELVIPVQANEVPNVIKSKTDNADKTVKSEPLNSGKPGLQESSKHQNSASHEISTNLDHHKNITTQILIEPDVPAKVTIMYQKPTVLQDSMLKKPIIQENSNKTTKKTELVYAEKIINIPALSLSVPNYMLSRAAKHQTAETHSSLTNNSSQSFMISESKLVEALIPETIPLPTRLVPDLQKYSNQWNSSFISFGSINQINKTHMEPKGQMPSQASIPSDNKSNSKAKIENSETHSTSEAVAPAKVNQTDAVKAFKLVADANKPITYYSMSNTKLVDANINKVSNDTTFTSTLESIPITYQHYPVNTTKVRTVQALIPDLMPLPTRDTIILQSNIAQEKTIKPTTNNSPLDEPNQSDRSGPAKDGNSDRNEEISSWWTFFNKNLKSKKSSANVEERLSHDIQKDISVSLGPIPQTNPSEKISLNELLKRTRQRNQMNICDDFENLVYPEQVKRPRQRQNRQKLNRTPVTCSSTPPPCPPKPPICPPPCPIPPPPICTPMPSPCRSPQAEPSKCPPPPPCPCTRQPSAQPPPPKKGCIPQPCTPPAWCPPKPCPVKPCQPKPCCPPPGPFEKDPCKKH